MWSAVAMGSKGTCAFSIACELSIDDIPANRVEMESERRMRKREDLMGGRR
jgi:hypothetical protein